MLISFRAIYCTYRYMSESDQIYVQKLHVLHTIVCFSTVIYSAVDTRTSIMRCHTAVYGTVRILQGRSPLFLRVASNYGINLILILR